MFQDLFSEMNQTLEMLSEDFDSVENMDDELLFIEKYLQIKEFIDDLTTELVKLNKKLYEFENKHGLADEKIIDEPQNKEVKKEPKKEPVIELELYEEDFIIFQRGIGYFDLWMYDKAIVQLENVIKKYPDFALARIYTAMTYLKKKDYSRAKEETISLIASSNDADYNSLAHNLLGIIFGQQNNFEQAILHFEQAIQLKEKWTEPKYNLAIIYYRNEQYVKAIKILEELYNENKNDWEVLFYLGKSYQKIKQLDVADNYYKKIYEITKDPNIVLEIAHHFEINGYFQKAILWYKRLLVNASNQVDAYVGLGKNVWLSGDKKTGISLVEKGLSIDNNNLDGLLIYAWMLTDKNDNTKILKVIDKLLNHLNKDDNEYKNYLVANLARLYHLNTNREDDGKISTLFQHSDNKHFNALADIVLGLINLDNGEPKSALDCFNKAVESGIDFPNLDFYIGYSHYLLGEVEETKNVWTKTK